MEENKETIKLSLINRIADLKRKIALEHHSFGPLVVSDAKRIFSPIIVGMEAELAFLERQLEQYNDGLTASKNDAAPPIPWIASDADFAELISELRAKGYIRAATDAEAYRIAAAHFEGVNKDARILAQGRKNRTTPHFENICPATASKKKKR